MAINPLTFTQPQPYSLVDQGQWDRLANLANIYRDARKRDTLADVGQRLANDEIDYKKAAGLIAGTGDLGSTVDFLKLAEARRMQDLGVKATENFASDLSRGFLGLGRKAETPEPAPPAQTAALPPPREPVPEIPGVIRTNLDGTIAGNITDPSIPAAPAPTPAPGTPLPVPRPDAAGAVVQEPPPVPADTARLPPTISNANATATGLLPPEQRLPVLMKAMMNPFLPPAQKELATKLLTETLSELKPHERIKFLEGLRDNPDLMALEEKLAKARSTQVNVNPAEKKYEEITGKDMAEKMTRIQDKGIAASRVLGTLNIMERALKDPNFVEGGPLLESRLAFRRAMASKVFGGLATEEGAAATELFQKAGNKMLIDILGGGDEKGGGLGAGFSNTDRTFYEQAGPNLMNSKAGNQLVIEMTRRGIERDKVVARMARDYVEEKRAAGKPAQLDHGFFAKLDDWAEKNPVFDGLVLPAETKPPPVTIDQIEAEMLRRGMRPL